MSNKTAVIDYDYKLTQEDFLNYGHKIAELDGEYDTIEGERKSSAASYKARLDDVESERRKLSRFVRTGLERRTGLCELHYDYDSGSVEYRLQDTGQTVLTREITKEERQLHLFSTAPDNPPVKTRRSGKRSDKPDLQPE